MSWLPTPKADLIPGVSSHGSRIWSGPFLTPLPSGASHGLDGIDSVTQVHSISLPPNIAWSFGVKVSLYKCFSCCNYDVSLGDTPKEVSLHQFYQP